MSFTAQVKDELSRIEGESLRERAAQLSSMIRVSGNLVIKGGGRYTIQVATETGSVARTLMKLSQSAFSLTTSLNVRKSQLHKSRNYLIEIPEQEYLAMALTAMGILSKRGEMLSGTPKALLSTAAARIAFIRGAFMASGFVANPRSRFHLEIVAPREEFAWDLCALIATLDVDAKLFKRRNDFVIYLKTAGDVRSFLSAVGARETSATVESNRSIKQVKNNVNRLINAELANEQRSVEASAYQLELIYEAEKVLDMDAIPPVIRDFCEIRRIYPEKSLAELGEKLSPPASKSAMYHRYLRLKELVQKAKAHKKAP